jgi:hypothetical protein
MSASSPLTALALVVLALVACGGRAVGGTDVNRSPVVSDGGGVTGTCATPDASVSGCTSARALLSCGLDGGPGEICFSDNFVSCPGPPPSYTPCTDQCGTSEYALACGGIGPMAPQYNAPPECRFAGANPGGVAYYCCPCE